MINILKGRHANLLDYVGAQSVHSWFVLVLDFFLQTAKSVVLIIDGRSTRPLEPLACRRDEVLSDFDHSTSQTALGESCLPGAKTSGTNDLLLVAIVLHIFDLEANYDVRSNCE